MGGTNDVGHHVRWAQGRPTRRQHRPSLGYSLGEPPDVPRLSGVLTLSAVPVRPGLSATVKLTVSENDTAVALSCGDVPVLATSRIVALVEEAAVQAVRGELEEGSSTVGVRVQIEHISPTPVGGIVTAEANLEKVEGRRLIFHVAARDERGLVAAGKVTRVLVNVERFLEKTR